MVKNKKEQKKAFRSVDKLSKELDAVDNFVLKHWKRYAIFGVIIIIALGVIMFVYESRHASSLKVSEDVITATTIPELQKVIKEYPDYSSVDLARLRLASKLYDEEKYEEAVKVYDSEIEYAFSKYTAGIGKLNKAYVLDEAGKNNEAVEQLKSLADDSQYPAIIRCEACYSAGIIYEAIGNTAQAKSMLEKCVADKGKCQFWPDMADKVLSRLN